MLQETPREGATLLHVDIHVSDDVIGSPGICRFRLVSAARDSSNAFGNASKLNGDSNVPKQKNYQQILFMKGM
jgi:hypothetical protein